MKLTNTLYRQGEKENLRNDYVIFVRPAGGYNREGCAPKLKEFLRICKKHEPVNLGTETEGEPGEPLSWEEQIEQVDDYSAATAVFADLDTLYEVICEIKEADLGLSVNISGLLEEVDECCQRAGIQRHSVEHSLGFHGATDRLPSRTVLEINSMCGHGLVSFNLIHKLVEQIKRENVSVERAAELMSKNCVCGAFNTTRAEQLLERLQKEGFKG